MPPTSCSQRQLLLDRYHSPSGQRDSGIGHLWHLEKLARTRLSPSHGIQDAPDVDFRDRNHLSDRQLRAAALTLDRHARQKHRDEETLRTANAAVFDKLVRATDSEERRRRHMNLLPETREELIEVDRLADQHAQRARDRDRRAKQRERDNAQMRVRLEAVRPTVPRTAQLNAWHRDTHARRLRDLSRFHKAEPFAGARVLESECNVHLPLSLSTRRAHSSVAPTPAGVARRTTYRPFTPDPPRELYGRLRDVRPPVLVHQPYPPLRVCDVLRHAPAALQPSHEAIHDGHSEVFSPSATLPAPTALTAATARATPTASQPRCVLARTLREARPAWQPVTATDIPLLHYTQDLALRTDARPLAKSEAEECGCTALWRRSVRHQREAYEEQRRAEALATSALHEQQEAQRASLKEKVSRGASPTPPRRVTGTVHDTVHLPARLEASGERVAAPRTASVNTVNQDVPHGGSAPTTADAAEGGVALSELLAQWRAVLETDDKSPFAPL